MDKQDYYYELFREQAHIEGLSLRIVEHVLKNIKTEKIALAKQIAELINGDKEWLGLQ